MVDIIKLGVVPGERNHETKCSNCNTHFRFKEAEAVFRADQRDGDFWEIKCPLCGVICTAMA
jgi:uncharacterized Zn-finger protein